MTLELVGIIALLVFALIGFGFVIGAIIIAIIYAVPNIKANREIDKAEAKKKLEEKLKELELTSQWVDLNTVEEDHICVLEDTSESVTTEVLEEVKDEDKSDLKITIGDEESEIKLSKEDEERLMSILMNNKLDS